MHPRIFLFTLALSLVAGLTFVSPEAYADEAATVSAVDLSLAAEPAVENELAFVRAQLDAGRKRLPRRLSPEIQAKALLRIAAAAGPASTCARALKMLPRRWGRGRSRQAIDDKYQLLIRNRSAAGQPRLVRVAALLAAAPMLREATPSASILRRFEGAFQAGGVGIKIAVLQAFARNPALSQGRPGALASRLLRPFVASLEASADAPLRAAAIRLLSQSRNLERHSEKAAILTAMKRLAKTGPALQRALALQVVKGLIERASPPIVRMISSAAAAESAPILRASALNLIGHFKLAAQLPLIRGALDDSRAATGEIAMEPQELGQLFTSLRRVNLGVGATVQIAALRALKTLTTGWQVPYVPQGYTGSQARQKLRRSVRGAQEWFTRYEADASAVR